MTLENVPVVNARVPRLACVTDYKPPRELLFVNCQVLALNPIGPQMETGSRSVKCRVEILNSRRHPDDGSLNIRSNFDEFAFLIAIPRQPVKRPHQGDRQR